MMEISSLSTLREYTIEYADDFDFNPLLTYSFTAEKFLAPASSLRVIPALNQISLDYNVIGKDARDFPVDFNGVNRKTALTTIMLPDNLAVKYMPESKVLDNPWFRLDISYDIDDNVFKHRESFVIKKRFVGREQYQEFKNFFKEALYVLREEVILEKNNEKK
jgi:hypothetical protein